MNADMTINTLRILITSFELGHFNSYSNTTTINTINNAAAAVKGLHLRNLDWEQRYLASSYIQRASTIVDSLILPHARAA